MTTEQIAAIALATVAATLDVAAALPRNRRLILIILLTFVIALVLIAP